MKKILNAYIRFMQRVLITILLTVVYFVFVAITLLFMGIFSPGKVWRSKKTSGSYWIDSPDEPQDLIHATQQS